MSRLSNQQQPDDVYRSLFRTLRMPTDLLLLIYARQSTKKQVINNRESWRQQREELQAIGLEEGWVEDRTILFSENVGKKGEIKSVSGTLRIDQRDGLSAAVEYIVTGKVGAVLVTAIDRLFRDEDAIEAATFAKICREYNVLVLTPDDGYYDFNDERREDYWRFIQEAHEAGRWVTRHIRRKMLKGRATKAARGAYASGTPPIGYTVPEKPVSRGRFDMTPVEDRQYIPTGHAPYVERVYQRFYDLDADFNRLYHDLLGKVVFPDDVEDLPEHRIYLTRIQGGWTIKSRSGLKYILTNLAYIGHMVFAGKIQKRNAHTAIVSEKLFNFAWEHLSDTDMDGNTIEREKRAVRYSQPGTVRDALLAGTRENGQAVITGVNGKQVYVMQHAGSRSKSKPTYEIRDTREMKATFYEGSIVCDELDEIIIARLLAKTAERYESRLQAIRKGQPVSEKTLDKTTRKALEKLSPVAGKVDSEALLIDKGIEETTHAIARQERHIKVAGDLMSDSELREAYATLKRMKTNLSELESKKANRERVKKAVEQARADMDKSPDKLAGWDSERKQNLIRLATESITLECLATGWLRLTIVWCPVVGFGYRDVCYLWRKSGTRWQECEIETLHAVYPSASRQAVQEALPARSWLSIRTKASDETLRRMVGYEAPATIPHTLSLTDVAIMQQYGLEQGNKRVWWFIVATPTDAAQS